MGRKSSAKKKRRAEKKTENIKEKKKGFFKKLKTSKSKKTKKKEPKKTTKKKQRKLKISKKQIFAGTLTLIMLTILVAVGYLLFQKAFKPRPIAKLLPADNTIAIVEINSNFDHHQLTKTAPENWLK